MPSFQNRRTSARRTPIMPARLLRPSPRLPNFAQAFPTTEAGVTRRQAAGERMDSTSNDCTVTAPGDGMSRSLQVMLAAAVLLMLVFVV